MEDEVAHVAAYIGDVLGLIAGSDDADDARSVCRLDGAIESRGDATAYTLLVSEAVYLTIMLTSDVPRDKLMADTPARPLEVMSLTAHEYPSSTSAVVPSSPWNTLTAMMVADLATP